MNIESYTLFITASVLLCIVPGPDMVYLLGRTIAQGKKAGIIAAFGINAGTYVHLFAAVVGISAIIATSSILFNILKWMGVIYLIYIGINAVLNKPNKISKSNIFTKQIDKSIFWHGFLSDVLNPKVAIFYFAFLPQFIDVSVQNSMGELLFLGLTLNMIGLTINIIMVYIATYVTRKLRRNECISKVLPRMMGAIFIWLGIRLASEKI